MPAPTGEAAARLVEDLVHGERVRTLLMSSPTGWPLVKETGWPMLPPPATKLVMAVPVIWSVPPLKTRPEAEGPKLSVALMLSVPSRSRVVPPV